LDFETIARHWYAHWYEHNETQTHDVQFLLDVLREQGAKAQSRILEIACGGGRIAIPLARAGFDVTGFDRDTEMLRHFRRKARGIPNLRCHRLDAETDDWGQDFDVAVLAGNFLINIESDLVYQDAQKLLFHKAAGALKPGGHLYLDFDLHDDPASVFHSSSGGEEAHTDDLGTVGQMRGYGSVYDPVTQICAGAGHIELTTKNGERTVLPDVWYKHIPTQAQVCAWLDDAGFAIERTYRNFTSDPLPRPITPGTHRATIWARKN
jgi:SAM-dependent methyltransferase